MSKYKAINIFSEEYDEASKGFYVHIESYDELRHKFFKLDKNHEIEIQGKNSWYRILNADFEWTEVDREFFLESSKLIRTKLGQLL
jgi:hypothetical protein